MKFNKSQQTNKRMETVWLYEEIQLKIQKILHKN